ncbi:rho family-interacting cell polarization regulator 1-like isoform X2 [Varroa destructor]|uniref:FAM65 N-terminal domain-containing protein n=1 Tax=Varroa destructor TaxID=109461 RepID=A0A7M7KEM6_VARDE|nr:rho family-interacting cell polarization regulator 1-like isoform X2 [Varroa destructor]XP_022659939.1 rho family-interacting cell polarization regulator 1-like isoform X2 [Varroa destructor]
MSNPAQDDRIAQRMSVRSSSANRLSSLYDSNGTVPPSGVTLGGSSLHRSKSFASSLSLRSNYDEGGGSGGTLGRYHNKLIPHPERTCELFEAVLDGLADCMDVTSEDIRTAEMSSRGNSPKIAFVASQYVQRLEAQYDEVERLRNRYLVQKQLRDGASEMGRAFVTSSLGRTREKALKGIRNTYRECEMTMKMIESQLETKCLGSLHLQINAMQGFARVCPGDQFLITIRHGEKKWKTRGKIGKSGAQTWDNREAQFRLSSWYHLRIKAVELKGLGRSVQLGERICEVPKLMRAQAQTMNVKFGTSGSLQLELVVVWNPLHGTEELSDTISKRSRPVSAYLINQSGLPPTPPSSGYASKSPVASRAGTDASSASGSLRGVEDALEAFSFLDEQDDMDSGVGHSRNVSPMPPPFPPPPSAAALQQLSQQCRRPASNEAVDLLRGHTQAFNRPHRVPPSTTSHPRASPSGSREYQLPQSYPQSPNVVPMYQPQYQKELEQSLEQRRQQLRDYRPRQTGSMQQQQLQSGSPTIGVGVNRFGTNLCKATAPNQESSLPQHRRPISPFQQRSNEAPPFRTDTHIVNGYDSTISYRL